MNELKTLMNKQNLLIRDNNQQSERILSLENTIKKL